MPENPKHIDRSGPSVEPDISDNLSAIEVKPVHEEADLAREIETNHPDKSVVIEGAAVHPDIEPTENIISDDIPQLNQQIKSVAPDSTEKYGLLQKIRNIRKNMFRRKGETAHAA